MEYRERIQDPDSSMPQSVEDPAVLESGGSPVIDHGAIPETIAASIDDAGDGGAPMVEQASHGEDAKCALREVEDGVSVDEAMEINGVKGSSQLLSSFLVPCSDFALEDKKIAAFEPASAINGTLESKETDDSQLVGSALEGKKSVVAINEASGSKEASIVHSEDELGASNVDDSQIPCSINATRSNFALEDTTTAFEPAFTNDSNETMERKNASIIQVGDSQLLGFSGVRHSITGVDEEKAVDSNVTLEGKNAGIIQVDDSQLLGFSGVRHSIIGVDEEKAVDSNETLEGKGLHLIASGDIHQSEAATKDAAALEPFSTIPVKGTLKGKEAIVRLTEEEGGAMESGLESQCIETSQPPGLPTFPPSTSIEEDGEAPILDPTNDDAMEDDAVQTKVEASEVVMDDKHRGSGGGRGRKKRGRVSEGQVVRVSAKKKKDKEDEEVCFICFDGGDLVVCGRRACPKVYHSSCVNRDEAFFRAKGQWNCGWHICSNCERIAQFMCYTCTFSLCKNCDSEAGFVRVRGNKGFCVTCMSTVMLIESNDDKEKKMAGIDFDDKTNWMYLFKDYWLDLKQKLLLTLEELTSARAPLKESNTTSQNESFDDLPKAYSHREVSSDSSSGPPQRISPKKIENKRSRNIPKEESFLKEKGKKRIKNILKEESSVKKAKRKRIKDIAQEEGSVKKTKKKRLKKIVQEEVSTKEAKKKRKIIVQEEGSSKEVKKKRLKKIVREESLAKEVESEETSTSEVANWASKELLELVAHMKGGDRSALSQFDVQGLLLEYIKRNKLRDPLRKSHIICDPRLGGLFGKERVGHFEMLKLLESHFLAKEPSPVVTDDNQEGVVDPDPGQMEIEGNSDGSIKLGLDGGRILRKRVQEKESQTNLDDYAAIDVHNINLIYLRRNLLEDLVDDIDTFEEKVVGAFVRIRIAGSGQRQDMYRLVQIMGTGKAVKNYRTGKKTTDFTLEILNLDKAEFITIDSISNQEFTEEECKRLRQSIRCGLIGRLLVGEVQEKASVLQTVRVNDWLESEKQRLGNLRDRASEKGRRKELRECVEKLQLLKTPEERIRRLNEVPDIHYDPKMDPDYESSQDEEEADDSQQDNSVFSSYGNDGISPRKGGFVSSNNCNTPRKSDNNEYEPNRNTDTSSARDVGSSTSVGQRTNRSSMNQLVHQTTVSEPSNMVNISRIPLNSGPSFETSPEYLPPPVISETEKIWRYQDPSGKIQGPFMITQLRKWNKSGHFPTNLKIWRTSERQEEDSILLSDALNGKFQKDLPEWKPQLQYNSTPEPKKISVSESNPSVQPSVVPRLEPAYPNNVGGPGISSVGREDRGRTGVSRWSSNQQRQYPTQQASSTQNMVQWNNQAAINPMSTPPLQPLISGWATAPTVIQGSNIAPVATNLVPGWSSNPTQNMLQQMVAMPNSAHFPHMIGSNNNQSSGNASLNLNPIIQQAKSDIRAVTQANESNTTSTSMVVHPSALPNASEFISAHGSEAANPSRWVASAALASGSVGPEASQPLTSNLGDAAQSSGVVMGPAQVNSNVFWGNANPSNVNLVWGIPNQGNPNLTVGWGTLMPGNANVSAGWGTPVQGNASSNVGWVPVAAPAMGAPNPNLGSGAMMGNTNQNVSWVTPAPPNAGCWVRQGNVNPTFNPSGGNPNGQQNDSGHGGGWSSRPPQRERMCRYHDSGHCLKGASCNYIHR